MKKFIFLIIMGVILFFMPEFSIVAGITTKMCGSALLSVVGLFACGVFLWKFHRCCERIVTQMREEQAKRMLEERDAVLFYPTVKALKAFGKYVLTEFLPSMFGVVFACISFYLVIGLSWMYIQPVLKYLAYAAGVLFVVILVACAFTTKKDLIDEAV